MKQELLKIEDVWKAYDMGSAGSLVVLKEVNINIGKGEFVAITGPSGSGKSTMMNIVGALDYPSWGSIKIKGENIDKMTESKLAKIRSESIGFIFQSFNLIPTLSAIHNVMLPMEFIDTPEPIAKKRAKELLDMLGLGDRGNHKPGELSGGQRQRVAIARSMANDPEIILADEPTGNLDSKTGAFVMEFLQKLNQKGKTIILITHDLELIKFAKRIIYIKDGKVERDTGAKKSSKMKGGNKK